MKNKEDIFVYYDSRDGYNYCTLGLDEKDITPERLQEYFGTFGVDDFMNNESELIIYKLVPYKKLKKNVKYEFV